MQGFLSESSASTFPKRGISGQAAQKIQIDTAPTSIFFIFRTYLSGSHAPCAKYEHSRVNG